MILLSFQLLGSQLVAQQLYEGRVVDAKTGSGIPFVNIGVPALGAGTVSNEEGQYRLTLKTGDHTILFSSIGYERLELPLLDLINGSEIKLNPKTKVLDEVVINASRYENEVLLGHKLNQKGNSIGFSGKLLGTEIGAHIKVKNETLLKSAHFTVNFTGADSLLFRVNIYDFSKGKLGDKLNAENIVIKAPQRKGTFDVNLEPYDILVKEDVLLSLEWIQGINNEGLMFRSKIGAGTNLYSRRTSFAPFTKIADEINFAPKLKIGFYLIGTEKG